MDNTVNNLIVEAKALEDVLMNLQVSYASGVDFSFAPVKAKVLRLLEIQRVLKEDYNITYDSSLLYDFTKLQEVNKDGDNDESPS